MNAAMTVSALVEVGGAINRLVVVGGSGPFAGMAGRISGTSIDGDVVVEIIERGRECVHFAATDLILPGPPEAAVP